MLTQQSLTRLLHAMLSLISQNVTVEHFDPPTAYSIRLHLLLALGTGVAPFVVLHSANDRLLLALFNLLFAHRAFIPRGFL